MYIYIAQTFYTSRFSCRLQLSLESSPDLRVCCNSTITISQSTFYIVLLQFKMASGLNTLAIDSLSVLYWSPSLSKTSCIAYELSTSRRPKAFHSARDISHEMLNISQFAPYTRVTREPTRIRIAIFDSAFHSRKQIFLYPCHLFRGQVLIFYLKQERKGSQGSQAVTSSMNLSGEGNWLLDKKHNLPVLERLRHMQGLPNLQPQGLFRDLPKVQNSARH